MFALVFVVVWLTYAESQQVCSTIRDYRTWEECVTAESRARIEGMR